MKNYRITYAPPGKEPVIVEGEASSKQNAARQAFRIMIKQEYIKNTPKTDDKGWFLHTTVEVLPEKERDEDE